MNRWLYIFLNSVPGLIMTALIPLVRDDYALAGLYALIIAASFLVHRKRRDGLIFAFGFFAMIVFEYIFISTGVEIFLRDSLFGVMPVWLPLLWGYVFVAIKRSVAVL